MSMSRSLPVAKKPWFGNDSMPSLRPGNITSSVSDWRSTCACKYGMGVLVAGAKPHAAKRGDSNIINKGALGMGQSLPDVRPVSRLGRFPHENNYGVRPPDLAFVLNSASVAVGIQSAIKLGQVIGADLEEPAVVVRRLVHYFWRVFQVGVDRNHFAGYRGINIGCGFNGFHHAGLFAHGQLGAHFRCFDEHHITQTALGIITDTDSNRAVFFHPRPLMAGQIFQFSADLTHESLPSLTKRH